MPTTARSKKLVFLNLINVEGVTDLEPNQVLNQFHAQRARVKAEYDLIKVFLQYNKHVQNVADQENKFPPHAQNVKVWVKNIPKRK